MSEEFSESPDTSVDSQPLSEQPRNVDSPAQVKRYKTKDQLRGEAFANSLHCVLKTYDGRAVIWKLLDEHTKIYAVSFTGEPNTTIFNEGKRAIGIEIMGWLLPTHRNFYNMMVSEAMKRDEEGKT